MEDTTRDIAVQAKQKVDSHVDDCIRFREILSKQYDHTQEAISALGDKIVALQLKMAAALGVLIFAGKIVDYILVWRGQK